MNNTHIPWAINVLHDKGYQIHSLFLKSFKKIHGQWFIALKQIKVLSF